MKEMRLTNYGERLALYLLDYLSIVKVTTNGYMVEKVKQYQLISKDWKHSDPIFLSGLITDKMHEGGLITLNYNKTIITLHDDGLLYIRSKVAESSLILFMVI